MSVGLTNTDVSFPELYRQADLRLYAAKLSGRNRTKSTLVQTSRNEADPMTDGAAKHA